MSLNNLNQQNMQYDMNCLAIVQWQDPSLVFRTSESEVKCYILKSIQYYSPVWFILYEYLTKGWIFLIWTYPQTSQTYNR